MDNRNNLIADKVVINAGQSWYSNQIHLEDSVTGIGFEIRLDSTGTVEGAFYPRAGNEQRYTGAAFVGTTDTQTLDSDHLPEMRVEQSDLIDVSVETPCETFLNLGNVNARYVELELRCTTGTLILSVRACAKRN